MSVANTSLAAFFKNQYELESTTSNETVYDSPVNKYGSTTIGSNFASDFPTWLTARVSFIVFDKAAPTPGPPGTAITALIGLSITRFAAPGS
ncbi:MAG: Uncharacterised protein [Chloroflexota bacterium]|nr:MAG: Uncharacterised protein [Chloroflexota bacterium]